MGFAVEHDHNGDESKTIIPCLDGWISILPCRCNYWITSSAPLPGKNQGLSFISMQFHSSKSRISSSAPSLYFSHVSDCWKLVHEWQWAWMVVPQWIWKSYNRAPPTHKKNTDSDNTQILSSHCQVNFSLCQGSLRAWEHDKEMQRTCFVRPTATGFATDSTLLMREGWSWIRLFFMSTPQQTHVLARPMEPGSNHP
jgi:hypothetical protein